ncbi:MAG: NAD(P)-binding domain-containing protein [Bryobacteraceae bacterium]
MNEEIFIYALIGAVLLLPAGFYFLSLRKRERRARESAARGEMYSEGPQAQHPSINTTFCIGCQSCTSVCPEGDVLAMLGGKAVIVNGHKCIGHSLCSEACPVGAITMLVASPRMGADVPYLTEEHETSVPNLFIAGELGGLALIKNAVNQGRDCIDLIAARRAERGSVRDGIHDVLIVGAGPAGISASLRAIEQGLNYLTIERDEIGGTVAKYPRQKMVMTSPVEFPLYGKFKKTELSKEALLEFWNKVLERADFKVRTHERVENIQRSADGVFRIVTDKGEYLSQAVVLALGKAGTPRKLGIPGEELPKVMYRLIEADHYRDKKILVVGGGDSAIEAAMGLANQRGNQVTLSYRKESFSRLKERNARRIAEYIRDKKLTVAFQSNPVEIRPNSVVLEAAGERREIENDFVWVFAGGVPPADFLRKIGVDFGAKDITIEAAAEARHAATALRQLAQA